MSSSSPASAPEVGTKTAEMSSSFARLVFQKATSPVAGSMFVGLFAVVLVFALLILFSSRCSLVEFISLVLWYACLFFDVRFVDVVASGVLS